jgi:hypothetical protein
MTCKVLIVRWGINLHFLFIPWPIIQFVQREYTEKCNLIRIWQSRCPGVDPFRPVTLRIHLSMSLPLSDSVWLGDNIYHSRLIKGYHTSWLLSTNEWQVSLAKTGGERGLGSHWCVLCYWNFSRKSSYLPAKKKWLFGNFFYNTEHSWFSFLRTSLWVIKPSSISIIYRYRSVGKKKPIMFTIRYIRVKC